MQEYFGSIESIAASHGKGVPGPGAYPIDKAHMSLSVVRSVSLKGRVRQSVFMTLNSRP